ncbi:hypothetical protein GDO81_026365 [Engystomops pustulosus]|uniref:UPAR/Ly6 domain-containing protein n=1 Tax=Engystomops pustulosus TaxID=76066 RepID=A0AAV6ZFN2_ENGPU|nr:hypothetical protein GDO81_026365 [Engystomops pustulosus]
MKNLMFLLGLVYALVVSVFSTKCFSCLAKNSTKCQKEMEIDCLGDTCLIASQYFHNGDHLFQSMLKGCGDDNVCGAEGSATGKLAKYRFFASCCTGNLCNTGGYKIPEEDLTSNGKVCPSCHITGTTDECESNETIKCKGTETRCFNYRAAVRNPDDKVVDYSVKGCSNSFACKVNFDHNIAIDELYRDELIC